MRRWTSILTIILFFIWILPLGVFIKPEKAKQACNGQRAICLCPHLVAKQMAKMIGKTFLRSIGGSVNKEESNSASSPHFLISKDVNQKDPGFFSYSESYLFTYNRLIVKSIEHVPKV